MSENTEPTSFKNDNIAICSAKLGLQVNLLSELIKDRLAVECTAHSDLEQITSRPTVLLLDCQGRDINQLHDIALAFHEKDKTASVALLNAEHHSDHEDLLEWPSLSGLFYIDTDQEQLIRGLEYLLNNDYWVPRRLLHKFLDNNRKIPNRTINPDASITKREKQILRLIRDGATNADISTELEVSEHTVKSHLYNIYKKIGVRNRLEASNWARNLSEADLT